MRTRTKWIAVALAATAFAACTLNPQPLPPGDDNGGDPSAAPEGPGGGFGSEDAGTAPPPTASDAGSSADVDASDDGGADGGDGGTLDGGDAGPDGSVGDGG